MQFSKDSTLIATGSIDGTVRVTQIEDSVILSEIKYEEIIEYTDFFTKKKEKRLNEKDFLILISEDLKLTATSAINDVKDNIVTI